MTDQELFARIDQVCEEFTGQLPDLYSMVGVVVVGRLYGWRVVRLTASKRVWSLVAKWFDDPKELMPERGVLSSKSIGLRVIDQVGGYWDFVRGSKLRDELSAKDRKMVVHD